MSIKKIGELLQERGLITQDQLEHALSLQESSGKRIGEILVEENFVAEDDFLEVMSERLKTPKITLESLVIDPHVIKIVPVGLARRYILIPIFRMGKSLTVAMADPLNIDAVDELTYSTGLDIKRAIASERAIRAAIEKHYSVQERLNSVIGENVENTSSDKTPLGQETVSSSEASGDEAPVVTLVNIIITKAVREGASDIHIEPGEKTIRIRYRVSGRMREEASPPKSLQAELISRIKIASELDVSEKRLPQDGRFSFSVDDSTVDLRVSTLPTIHGEKIVIRILDPRKIKIGLKQLGMGQTLAEAWDKLIRLPEGLVLISGPTSSGKTTTLYSSIQEINSMEKNIITIEDPVEYSLPLINQVQTNDRAGLTFASCLRSILRQNPDIIMIGEIRDSETAAMAVRSSLTGHLVFSTIHANDTASSVTRLTDIGVEHYLVASALKGALAQRLVRLNCPECLEEYAPPAAIMAFAQIDPTKQLYRSAGCSSCRMTGHSGMTALYEYLPICDTIREMIARGDSDGKIKQFARQSGMRTLFSAGLELLYAKSISLEELLQVATPDTDTIDSATGKAIISTPSMDFQ